MTEKSRVPHKLSLAAARSCTYRSSRRRACIPALAARPK